ncbi:hypothetical protein [Streptomyces hygroscopicus]|nr:hypothetical protein [Streptomyces hygroscopicus]
MFAITVRSWCDTAVSEIEIVDMASRDSATGRLLAITAIEIEV